MSFVHKKIWLFFVASFVFGNVFAMEQGTKIKYKKNQRCCTDRVKVRVAGILGMTASGASIHTASGVLGSQMNQNCGRDLYTTVWAGYAFAAGAVWFGASLVATLCPQVFTFNLNDHVKIVQERLLEEDAEDVPQAG